MKTIVFAVMFFVASNGLCQAQVNEHDTLQSLLVEVRQLRMAIQAMTAGSQRAQIALSQLQIQDGAVARATQRLEDTHNRCTGAEANRQHTATDIQRLQTALDAGTVQADQVKEIQPRLTDLKIMLDSQAAEVQACQTAEGEAAGQLQNEHTKLTELQERIDRLDKTLEKLSGAP
jgi:chromosome segregation ATPase